MASNNNNNGEKYNPFRDITPEWTEESPLNDVVHSPFNPFISQEGNSFDTTTQHYSPSDLPTSGLIDLQQGPPQSPAQAASSSHQQPDHFQPNYNTHLNNERRGKKENKENV